MTRFVIQQMPPATSFGGGVWSYASGPWTAAYVAGAVEEIRERHPQITLRVVTTTAPF